MKFILLFQTEVLQAFEKKPSVFQDKPCQTVFENVFVHTPLISSTEGNTTLLTLFYYGHFLI